MSDSSITHLIVVDPDVTIAKAVTSLALDVLPPHTETVIAKTPTEDGARRLIGSLPDDDSRVIVVCSADVADGGKGLNVLRFVRTQRPTARVVLLTNGERRELVAGLVSGADSVLPKPLQLGALRSVLAFLGSPPVEVTVRRHEPDARMELRKAVAALESALAAVERASDRVLASAPGSMSEAQRALREAEMLAASAHRRALEAEQRLADQSHSTTS